MTPDHFKGVYTLPCYLLSRFLYWTGEEEAGMRSDLAMDLTLNPSPTLRVRAMQHEL
jgi:hypothetical protein